MIELLSVKDHGFLERERAVFRVLESGNIGTLMVHCALSLRKPDGRSLQNKIFDTYWFVNKQVEEGDLVVLYTKDPGVYYKSKVASDGTKTHFFYWRSEHVVWSRENVALVVGTFSNWATHHIETDEEDIEP